MKLSVNDKTNRIGQVTVAYLRRRLIVAIMIEKTSASSHYNNATSLHFAKLKI